MKLSVERYDRNRDYHVCRDEVGDEHRVDLLVDGGISVSNPESLVGRTVYCVYLHPFVEIAVGVRWREGDAP